ncbi:MAG: hypothetical protein AAFO29_25395, partial [Actinomycetota bacterium]
LELASTNAELEAKSQLSGQGLMAPPVGGPDALDGVRDPDLDDELDSAAAEVRSALRGPSVLDTIADGSSPEDVEPDPAEADGALALAEDAELDVADVESTDAGVIGGGVVDDLPAEDDEPAMISGLVGLDDDATDGAPSTDEVEAVVADAVPEPATFEDVPPPSSFQEVPVQALDDEDDLDEVSELIARTMSTFSPNDLTGLGPADEDSNDLDPDESVIDTDETVGVSSMPPSILGDAPESFGLPDRPDLSGPRTSGPKRRRIEVPGDIIDDEVAAARFVVSSPDVVLLVDGDSVAQMGWPKLPVAQQRDALVTYLADLSATTGAAPDVVFDGRIGDGDSLPASRAVRIRLSTPPTPPTAALDELVDAYPEQWPIA